MLSPRGEQYLRPCESCKAVLKEKQRRHFSQVKSTKGRGDHDVGALPSLSEISPKWSDAGSA